MRLWIDVGLNGFDQELVLCVFVKKKGLCLVWLCACVFCRLLV